MKIADRPKQAIRCQKPSTLASSDTDTIYSEKNLENYDTPQNECIRKNIIEGKQIKFNNKLYKNFNKKINALNYIQSQNNSNLKLFSEDLSSENGSKRFIVSTYDNIYHKSSGKECHMYENYEADQKLKLILDIDYKTNKRVIDNDAFDDLLVRCVDTVNEKLKNLSDVVPKLIILKSCRAEKMSAHIIYTNIHFESISQMKCFMMTIESQLVQSKIIDPNIYKVSCMRLLWNSKLGKSNILEYDEDSDFLMDSKYDYVNEYKLFMDCLITNIYADSELIRIDIPSVSPIITKVVSKNKNKRLKAVENVITDNNNRQYDIKTIKQYVDLLSPKRADDYVDWLNVGMCIYNCNSSKEAFDLWNEWSMKSESYDRVDVLYWKWNSFNNRRKMLLSIGTLKYYAKNDNPEKYDEINHPKEDPLKFNAIKIEQNYLLEENEIIKKCKSVVATNVCNWLNSKNIKTLGIKSPYNTGKTSMISKLMEEFNPKRILFITHRQSLTNELYGTFKKYRFCSYLNRAFDANRLVCQIESLHKITDSLDPFYYNPNGLIQTFDLVILDEIESLLYHFESPTVISKRSTFELFVSIIRNSKKVLALDGDFHNRGYDFISSFGESIIIHNTIKKDPKKYLFTNNIKSLDESIDSYLKDNKKIVIISMSPNMALKYYKKYKDTYKVLVHHGKSNDNDKNLLKNVEENWKQRDLVVYTSSVQSGVSFNVQYFSKLFVILSKKSCSSRDLHQMCHRVRQFECNDVDVYLNGLPYKENAKFFTYDDAKGNVASIYDKYVDSDNVSCWDMDKSLYGQVLIYNELENINKSVNLFVPMFIKLITEKGNTYSFDDSKKTKVDVVDFTKEAVLNAEYIDKHTFDQYMVNQMRNEATSDMKYAIEKYLYKKHWNVDEVDEAFLDHWYRKTYVLRNLKLLLKFDELNDNDVFTVDKHTDKKLLDYDKAKDKQRLTLITDLIDKIGFDIDNIGKEHMLAREDFENNKAECLEQCKIFTDPTKSGNLFGVKIKTLYTTRAFMGLVNSVLHHYGVCICIKQNGVWDKINKKKINTYGYYLDYYQNINYHL